MRTVLVSGWGQTPHSLSHLAPQALPIPYAHHDSAQEAIDNIAAHAHDAQLAIGWSLGAQLLVRACAEGRITPKTLVLIAPAYQFVSMKNNGLGMAPDHFAKFRGNYAANPVRTLNKAWELIAKGDTYDAHIRHHLQQQDKDAVLAQNWLRWLDILEGFSCDDIALDRLPRTLLIHGDQDAVVYHAQSERFAQRIPDVTLVTFEGCGHAPHWHNPGRVTGLIAEHAHV